MIDALAGADGSAFEPLLHAGVGIAGFGALAALVGAIVAAGHRRVTLRRVPNGASALVGLVPGAAWAVVTTWSVGSPLVGTAPARPANASFVLALLAIGAGAAVAGGWLGDRIACELCGIRPVAERDEVGSLVAAARATVTVDLPESIADAPGYRPVDRATKRRLAGRSIRFPRRCSTGSIESRLAGRLERDFGIDHVACSLADDGAVERLEAGRRPAGIGPTLPPESAAVAIRADPPPTAAPGDPVEVWEVDGGSGLVATGTVLATAADVATVVVDEADAGRFGPVEDRAELESRLRVDGGADRWRSIGTRTDPERPYRLVTRADRSSDGHRFLSALRGATETVAAVTVESGGPFDGEFVGWLPGAALVMRRDERDLAFPADSETLRAGDRLWVLGTPPELGRLGAGDLERWESNDPPVPGSG